MAPRNKCDQNRYKRERSSTDRLGVTPEFLSWTPSPALRSADGFDAAGGPGLPFRLADPRLRTVNALLTVMGPHIHSRHSNAGLTRRYPTVGRRPVPYRLVGESAPPSPFTRKPQLSRVARPEREVYLQDSWMRCSSDADLRAAWDRLHPENPILPREDENE